MIDAPLSFAYHHHTQRVEVTEYTTSHGRHTKRLNYIESDPDDEDDLHHGTGGRNANNLFHQDKDQVEVVRRQTRSLAATRRTNGSNVREETHARVHSDDEGQVSVTGPVRMTEVDRTRLLLIPLPPMRALMLLVMWKLRMSLCPRVC